MGEVENTSSAGPSPEQNLNENRAAESSVGQPILNRHKRSADIDPVIEVLETDLTNKQVGRYLVQRRLGSGGSAVVYQAFDQVRGRSVALKVLASTADEKMLIRFRREAMTSGALHHEHIVRTLQVGVAPHGDVAYIAMELIEGESLEALLNRCNYLDPDEACALLAPIASALAHAHDNEIIHRDVKPSNILLQPTRSGNQSSVYIDVLDFPVVPMLSDFGIARSLDSPDLTNQGRTVGTPAYMAPEQCAGQRHIDGRADIYSLGAVLYRAIVGHQPFTGTTPQILHAHVYEPLTIENEILRRLPPLIVEILVMSLAKNPNERYADAGQMAIALAEAGGVMNIVVPNGTQPAPTATITLDNLPPSNNDPLSSASVLVPGVPGKTTQDFARQTTTISRAEGLSAKSPVPPPVTRPRQEASLDMFGPPAETVNWSGFALLSVGVLIGALTALVMSGQLARLFGDGGNGANGPTITETVTITAVSETALPAGVLSITPSPMETVEPITETDTPDGIPPTITLIPTQPPLETPTPVDTATPVPTETPIATTTAVPTVVPAIVVPTSPPTETWTPVPASTDVDGAGTSTLPPTFTPAVETTPTVEGTATTEETPTPEITATPTATLIPPTSTWTPNPGG